MYTKTKIKTVDKILFVVLIVLLALYILSFTKSCSSTDNREIVKTALVNKKYDNKIDAFKLVKGSDVLLLSKTDNIWYIDSSKIPEISLPADTKRIEDLISDLINIHEMYKVSDTLNENNSFGLTDENAFTLRYYFSDSFNDIIFGNQDFALSSRYMMSGKSTVVYELSNIFDKYLTTSIQSWAEPYIISQQILGSIKGEDVQRAFLTFDKVTSQFDFDEKLLDLRHGGFPTDYKFSIEMFNNPLLSIKLELGNKSCIKLDIVQSVKGDEQEYDVAVEYINNIGSSYKSYSKISSWTYNKIKEITL